MNLKNMRECDNSKIHISNNSLFSICLLLFEQIVRVVVTLLSSLKKM